MTPQLTIDLSKFTSQWPAKLGKYLVNYELSKTVELVTIYMTPETNHGGLIFESQPGILEQRGRHPSHLRATWMPLEIV